MSDEMNTLRARIAQLEAVLREITRIGPLGVGTYPECYRLIQIAARAALAPEAAERGYTSTATTMPKQCTPADAAAMQAVIKALEDEKAARKAPRPTAKEGGKK